MTGTRVRRVLMTADSLGGVFTFAVELAAGLVCRGVDVVLATMGGRLDAAQRELLEPIRGLVVEESDFGLEWMDGRFDEVEAAGEWLLDLARRHRPDIVHSSGYSHAALPFEAPVVVTAHSCVLSWWRAVFGSDAPSRYDEYRRRVALGIASAEVVVAPSDAMLRTIVTCYGAPARALVVHNGRSAPMAADAKEPFVAAVGRVWDQGKNMAALDRAARSLPWPVLIGGDTVHPDGSRRTLEGARSLGRLAPRSVAALLARASIYVLPAKYEPFGLSALEAALAGCALVLGDIPSLRELWHGAAVFVDPDDDGALGAAIHGLIDRPREREALAGRAAARAARYTAAAMTAGYLAAYDVAAPRIASSTGAECA